MKTRKGEKVTIVEVGLRDGLQNESTILSRRDRSELAKQLREAGLRKIELGSFVSPKWVPQMAGSADLYKEVKRHDPSEIADYSFLVPNVQGMEEAIKCGVKEISVFAACSESFSKKNINCSIEESFARFAPVMKLAKKHKIKVRGYLSVCFGCPFEGDVPEKRVVDLALRMSRMGVYEISIGDTIGVAHVGQVRSLFRKLKKVIPVKKLAGHFHNTRGQALANVLMAYQAGVRVFDSSIGGLGGCPYAPGATGNLATEDLVFMLDGLGCETGVSLAQLININPWLSQVIHHELASQVSKASCASVPKMGQLKSGRAH